ncbi:PAS domain-containing sensor histidine kinase [Bradyrhizobium sp. AZCC 2289]|uniref:PAS domain-containing sensor histidine kinase n=1 Tax=Bradyrhizobium sp. AZCC 2289 TaxID=3117026 RepID=UPI002FF25DF9
MRRRSKAGSTKPRRRKAPAARRRRSVETIRGVTSSASKEELRFALLKRKLSEARRHQRRAEEALRESEHQLHQIIDTVPSFLWSADPTGEPTYVNQRALDYSGMRFEEFKHGGWEVFIHPADFPGTIKAFSHAIETGTPYETVHRLRRWDGEYRWHQARGDPLRDRDGLIIQWYGVAVDIDDAKKAEDRLRRSEAYLAEAQRLTHTATAAYDATKILYFSDEAFRLFGFDPLQGLPSREAVWQRIHPDDVETVKEKIEHALHEKRSFQNEFRLKLPDGTLKHVEADILPVFSATGEFVEIIATAVDVTERKRAEDTLRRGQAWLAQAQRLSHTGTWVLDGTTRRFLHWSDESYRIWGFDPLQGLPSRDDMWGRIHPDDRERLWGEVQEALREKRDFFEEFRILLPDGTVKWLEANTHHEFSPLGALLEVVCTNIDVTERNRAQDEREQLRQLEAELAHINRVSTMGELAASLSHEILHPIATARNNARAGMRFLEMNPPNLDEAREALGCVVRDADRAKDIVGRIRNQIKRAPPRKMRFGLHEAVNEVIVMVQSAIAKNGISFSTRLMDGLVPVQGDRVQLQQVLVNLILNAIEAMSSIEDGTRELSIRTEQSQTGGILVAVHDSGPGVDPVNLERVFEPFYTTKTSGIGMGLSICQTIINGHGGRLWMSANEPRGAVFQFTLPAAQEDS